MVYIPNPDLRKRENIKFPDDSIFDHKHGVFDPNFPSNNLSKDIFEV